MVRRSRSRVATRVPFLDGVPPRAGTRVSHRRRGSWPPRSATRRLRGVRLGSTASGRRRSSAAPSTSASGAGEDGYNRGGLSADGSMLALEHAEHGDMLHPALRVVDPRTGDVSPSRLDEGMTLLASCWSPVGGRPTARRHPRARGRGASRDLGASRPACGRDLDIGLDGPVLEPRLVARRVGPAPRRAQRTRAVTASTDTSSRRLADADRAPIGPRSARRACDPTAACGSGSRAARPRRGIAR